MPVIHRSLPLDPTRHAARLFAVGAIFALGACAGPDPASGDDDFPLSDVDSLYEDAPADRGMSIPFDGKADENLPNQFDLVAEQSGIRSQGRRGTCTIFATTALMEHLYIREGSLMNPDFSEQFLQWSAKFEVNSFPNSSGSNSSYNLQAINRFGIVREEFWPYEESEWGVSDDPECTGDSRPTRCYTNGEPPAEALSARRYNLPRGRWINPSVRSIQGHMVSTRTAVVAGGTFFYQSWNHRKSNLPVNSEYSANGYVLSPNAEDVADSSGDRRAGHGFLLVGWDNDLAVPRVDGEGNQIIGEDGEPEMETGFFLFKNSWGTSRFGVNNPHGAGYGWISYRYVEEHLTAYVSGLPELREVEICNDGVDNDRMNGADCDDPACASDHACMDPGDSTENNMMVAIPDNDPAGIGTTITISDGGDISSLAVTVDIAHSYRGDLRVILSRDDGTQAILSDRDGGSADDIQETFSVTDFNGTDAAGTYTLQVIDTANADTGSLNGWSLDITRCTSDCGGVAMARTYTDTAGAAIDDLSTLDRTLNVPDAGTISEMSVTVDLTHSYPYDLTIRLTSPGGRSLVLLTEDTSSMGGIQRTFDVPGVIGDEAMGDWTLSVIDGAAGDSGTLNEWSMQIATN